nr:reverse transcriptase domain-containing protein [Tanacetum cinerariifolium]
MTICGDIDGQFHDIAELFHIGERQFKMRRLALISNEIYESMKDSCRGNYVDPNIFLCSNSLQRVDEILNSQAKAVKEENVKDENLCGMDKEFEIRLDGTRCIRSRSWLPHFVGLRDLIMHESHKSK